jgi:hypothetical protein
MWFEIHPNADKTIVWRYVEAYVMWLFKWVMFCNADENSVDKTLVLYQAMIDDAKEGQCRVELGLTSPSYDLPRPLSTVHQRCTKMHLMPSLQGAHFCYSCGYMRGCQLLLQLWLYERFAIVLPRIDLKAYMDVKATRVLTLIECGCNTPCYGLLNFLH